MKKVQPKKDDRRPVARVVHEILEQANIARTDGPSSGLYGRDAQLSGALTQAGTLLAKMDRAAPAKKSSVLHNLLGAPAAPKERRRRSWFFASKTEPTTLDTKRIEEMLRATAQDGRPLVLDRDPADGQTTTNGDIDCHLPDGAVDPVCAPR
jgi:hypothetical protein